MLVPVTASPLQLTQGTPITPEEICLCCGPLLSHDEYMTTYLEREYRCHIHLEKISQSHNAKHLIRQVLLNDQAHQTYIISQIKIYLAQFSLATQEQLIHSNLPFGRILAELEVTPTFSKRQFLKQITPYPLISNLKPARLCKQHFQPYTDVKQHANYKKDQPESRFTEHCSTLPETVFLTHKQVECALSASAPSPSNLSSPAQLRNRPVPAVIQKTHFGRFHQILDHRACILADVYEWIA